MERKAGGASRCDLGGAMGGYRPPLRSPPAIRFLVVGSTTFVLFYLLFYTLQSNFLLDGSWGCNLIYSFTLVNQCIILKKLNFENIKKGLHRGANQKAVSSRLEDLGLRVWKQPGSHLKLSKQHAVQLAAN